MSKLRNDIERLVANLSVNTDPTLKDAFRPIIASLLASLTECEMPTNESVVRNNMSEDIERPEAEVARLTRKLDGLYGLTKAYDVCGSGDVHVCIREMLRLITSDLPQAIAAARETPPKSVVALLRALVDATEAYVQAHAYGPDTLDRLAEKQAADEALGEATEQARKWLMQESLRRWPSACVPEEAISDEASGMSEAARVDAAFSAVAALYGGNAESALLRAEVARMGSLLEQGATLVHEKIAEIGTLKSRLAVVEGALAPFSLEAATMLESVPDSQRFVYERESDDSPYETTHFKACDLRRARAALAATGEGPTAHQGIYIASKVPHAKRWRALRAEGVPFVSTWIDEAGAGETSDWSDLWRRCVREASTAKACIVYREEGETLKGALVEMGAALARGAPVYWVGPVDGAPSNVVKRAGVTVCATLEQAIAAATGEGTGARGKASCAHEYASSVDGTYCIQCGAFKPAEAEAGEGRK